MKYTPLNYSELNSVASTISPTDINYSSYSFGYWERALFQRACYSLKITEPTILKGDVLDFFYYSLFKFGFLAFWDDSKYGKIFNPCTLYGFDIYYQPTEAIITNPRLQGATSRRYRIGEECEVIKLSPDYMGIWDIIQYYAMKLSSIDPAIDVSVQNSKVPFILTGRTKGAIATLKKMVDQIIGGKSAIFIDERILPDLKDGQSPINFLDRPQLKNSYVTDMLLRDMQTILNSFDAEIGIPTVPYEKKERMVVSEAESKEMESQARVTIWKDCLSSSFEVVNEKYGTNFNVETRLEIDRKESEEVGETNSSRNLQLSESQEY